MFKKKDKLVKDERTPEQVEADKIIARGERIKQLGEEAGMWRAFSAGCKDGRHLFEHLHLGYGLDAPPRLAVRMDVETAVLWREFAQKMADHADKRL